jgi:signal transduction histidine kinase
MPADLPNRAPAERSSLERALLALAAAAVITGGGSLWTVVAAPAGAAVFVGWACGVAAAITCAAVAATVYYADSAHQARDRIARAWAAAGRLEQELTRLLDETLPVVVTRLRDGESVERVLAGVPHPATGPLKRLVHTLAREIGAAERRGVAAMALRGAMEDDAARLADETLPALVARLRAGESADAALTGAPSPASPILQRLLGVVAREIGTGERRGAAAMAACASAAARVQAQTTRTLAELRELEHRYSEDKVFADLLELDHRISQMGRLADGIALLSGGRSGRRWTKPIVIESILRGAMGRIDAYRRVRVHSASTVAIAGFAAEGVMHALAELMDNAAAFSAHGSEVQVYVEEEDAGVVVTIEDSGLGMRKRERRRAEALVSEALDLTTLPGTRLGLAVVGRLASRYGLTVSFRPSSRGGTGVVVMIPRQLVTQLRDDALPAFPAPGDAPAPARSAVPAGAGGARPPSDPGGDGAGLPKRPPGQTLAAATRTVPAAAEAPAPAGDRGARFAAFHQAGDRGRKSAPAAPDTDPR